MSNCDGDRTVDIGTEISSTTFQKTMESNSLNDTDKELESLLNKYNVKIKTVTNKCSSITKCETKSSETQLSMFERKAKEKTSLSSSSEPILLSSDDDTDGSPLFTTVFPKSENLNFDIDEHVKNNKSYELPSSEDELPYIPLMKRLKEDKEKVEELKNKYISTNINTITANQQGDKQTTLKKRRSNPSSESKKLEKEKLKFERQLNQEQKKEEALREKELKKALTVQDKNIRPDQCQKFVTVKLDINFQKEPFYEEVIECIQEFGSLYKTEANLLPYTVTWSRLSQTHLMSDNGQLSLASKSEDTNEILLILNWKEVVKYIHEDSLVEYIHNVQMVYPNKRISLGIYGFENYFKYWKNNKKRDEKAKVTGTTQNKNKYDKLYQDSPQIGRRQLEMALTEIQILYSSCARFVETPKDVGVMVVNFTKSIAQIPYKLEKQQRHQQIEKYLSGDNKDCVRVDKFGNGLQRLWKQQLTSFPLASLETAEAVTSNYPTLSSLMEAYENTENGQFLLQDIPIRRAAGPFSSVRKLGPEFSKKLHTYYNSLDGNVIL